MFVTLGVMTMQSCSSDSDNDGGSGSSSSSGDSYWNFAGNKYTMSPYTSHTTAYGLSTVVATTNSDTSHGNFSGSSLVFTFNDKGVGEYLLVTDMTLASNNGADKVMMVRCMIGTGVTTGSSLYSLSSDSNVKAQVTKDENGKYHVTINSPVTLTKVSSGEVNGGIAGSKNSYELTANNIY